ncbi:MAG: glutaredoxin family protein, partial [Xenophilus sp.]
MNTAHLRLGAAAFCLAAAGAGAGAQGLYRQVDAGGRVTYTDQPPAASARPIAPAPSGGTDAGDALPYELRQVVRRYPVTLYTGDDCLPCEAGRNLLLMRGIPFDERTVKTTEDSAALERLSDQSALPLLAIGAQQVRGFSDVQWSRYLDAAGYAKSVQLPAGYRRPPARPLVAQQRAAAPAVAPGEAP